MTSALHDAIALLQEFRDDSDISKKLKEKIDSILTLLTSNANLAVDKALLELEDLNSLDISSYHRTQLWDIISLLESAKS